MRATYLAWQLLGACAVSSLLGCAEGGLSDAELDPDAEARQAGNKSDAGKLGSRDARAESDDDQSDDSASTTRRDAGSGAARDSSTSNASGGKDAGSAGGAAAIKCPSPLICTNAISSILSLLDPSVQTDANLCAQKGSLIPMAVTCSSTDECKNARLTTATCSGGNCVQPCTP